MPAAVYIPHDLLAGPEPDGDLAADIAELSAFFSDDMKFLLSDLRNDIEIGEDVYRRRELGSKILFAITFSLAPSDRDGCSGPSRARSGWSFGSKSQKLVSADGRRDFGG